MLSDRFRIDEPDGTEKIARPTAAETSRLWEIAIATNELLVRTIEQGRPSAEQVMNMAHLFGELDAYMDIDEIEDRTTVMDERFGDLLIAKHTFEEGEDPEEPDHFIIFPITTKKQDEATKEETGAG